MFRLHDLVDDDDPIQGAPLPALIPGQGDRRQGLIAAEGSEIVLVKEAALEAVEAHLNKVKTEIGGVAGQRPFPQIMIPTIRYLVPPCALF